MKALSACILICSAGGLAALDSHPQPGLALAPETFTDIRAFVGMASSVSTASVPGASLDCDMHLAPRAGLQVVRGKAGDTYGLALGLEYAYDDHLGTISSFSGTNTAFGADGGLVALRTHSLNLLPRVVLRPDYDDPFDWGPGSVQIEIGPVIGAGLGSAHIGGSGHSDQTTVLNYGARAALVITSPGGWQGGIEAGWDAFTADPSWKGANGSISGNGFLCTLLIGHRL